MFRSIFVMHAASCGPVYYGDTKMRVIQNKLEIAQSEQDVSPFCKESDMTYSWKFQIGLFLRQ